MDEREDAPLPKAKGKSVHPLAYLPADELPVDDGSWREQHKAIEILGRESLFIAFLHDLLDGNQPLTDPFLRTTLRKHARKGMPWLSKPQLLAIYRQLCEMGLWQWELETATRLQMKPIRSQSGVAVVTVLTKPYPCPGQCIFCPTDVRMPKSYLHDEPGAQRAERNQFDPYLQTASRLQALENLGHPTDKIELLILGGTWSSYRRDYQEWFVLRCFDAINGVDSADLPTAHALNTTTKRRNVGLVVETRQDHISADELRWLRYLGVTKVQVGIQSLDDRVLALNKRGHDVQATREAFRLLRLGGFKIHGHWMANLLGATPDSDSADYLRIWSDPAIRPDELKIYPCMLVPNAELHQYYLRGEYQPYQEEEVVDLLVGCFANTPRYTRLTRVIRDIPTNNVVAGMKKANLREVAERKLAEQGKKSQDIRSREIGRTTISWSELELREEQYETWGTTEWFLSYESADDKLVGFLRLSLPHPQQPLPLPELADHAIIREVHVYGPVVELGNSKEGDAQHIGIGAHLIAHAKQRARLAGYDHLAVISAVGTQNYYAKHGFAVNGLYMTCDLLLDN